MLDTALGITPASHPKLVVFEETKPPPVLPPPKIVGEDAICANFGGGGGGGGIIRLAGDTQDDSLGAGGALEATAVLVLRDAAAGEGAANDSVVAEPPMVYVLPDPVCP